MECKNPHCRWKTFSGIVDTDTNRLVALKCVSCGAIYSMDEIEITKKLKREGWNSVQLFPAYSNTELKMSTKPKAKRGRL